MNNKGYIRAGFSQTFQNIIQKYLKEEKRKKLKLQIIRNPSKILIEEILRNKNEMKVNENDDLKNLLLEEKLDFDLHKFMQKNQGKIDEQNKSENKKISKDIFLNKFKKRNKRNKINQKIIIQKSLSQNLFPSILNFNKAKYLEFPNILCHRQIHKNKSLQKFNLLNKLDNESKLNTNINYDTLKSFYNFSGKKISKSIIKYNYNNYYKTVIKGYNKKNYFNNLTLLTNKSKEISKNLTFYSNNENLFINKQIKKTSLIAQIGKQNKK